MKKFFIASEVGFKYPIKDALYKKRLFRVDANRHKYVITDRKYHVGDPVESQDRILGFDDAFKTWDSVHSYDRKDYPDGVKGSPRGRKKKRGKYENRLSKD